MRSGAWTIAEPKKKSRRSNYSANLSISSRPRTTDVSRPELEINKMKIKAISLHQPWANLVASGEKTIETRTWKTSYRGPLLICSSKIPTCGLPSSQLGVALCVVDLLDCRPMTRADECDALCELYPGAYAWVLGNPTPITNPFRVRGRQRIFEIGIFAYNDLASARLLHYSTAEKKAADTKVLQMCEVPCEVQCEVPCDVSTL